MAIDKELYAALKTANRRINTLQRSENLIYEKTTNKQIEALRAKAAGLTGVTEGNLRIGDLDPADRDRYLNILKRFNESDFSTVRGQKSIMRESKKKFEENFAQTDENGNTIPIDDKVYEEITHIMESDTWAKFSEKYMTYSNVISDMVANPKSYDATIEFITDVIEHNKFMTSDGNVDVDKFIKAYKQI